MGRGKRGREGEGGRVGRRGRGGGKGRDEGGWEGEISLPRDRKREVANHNKICAPSSNNSLIFSMTIKFNELFTGEG